MKRKIVKKRMKKVGAPPGTLQFTGENKTDKVVVEVVRFDGQSLEEISLDPEQLQQIETSHEEKITWVNVGGLHDIRVIESLGEKFQIHQLVMEDILNIQQRPKVEDYGRDYLYIVVQMLRHDEQTGEVHTEQISLVLGSNFVLTFQENPTDVFGEVRKRLTEGRRIRFMRSDYLAYALLDTIVDNYFPILERIGNEVEALEIELINNPTPSTLAKIHHYKRELLLLRKSVWPIRDVISALSRDESNLIASETRVYLRDIHDHALHIIDTLGIIRDLLGGLHDLYLTSIGNRTNEIMKHLTIFASIFMPLTFLAGIYGMNFEYMPELQWPWAYFATLGLMTAVALGLLLYFRKRRWL
ncbi:MAG: magnesium/cobalt transporter CorA [Candidatus Sumerlaeia bacterium]|nr:magnesium/cobalt transporter CorA [Candidatus Sumerlaeia bacterium]